MLAEAFGRPSPSKARAVARCSTPAPVAPPSSRSAAPSCCSPARCEPRGLVGRSRATSRARASSRRTSSIDRFALFFCFMLCLGGGLAALLAGGYLPEHELERGEFYPLLLFSTVGAMVLAAAGDLLTLFVGARDDVARRVLHDRPSPRQHARRPRRRSSTSCSAPSRPRCCCSAARCSTAPPATPTSPASVEALATIGTSPGSTSAAARR